MDKYTRKQIEAYISQLRSFSTRNQALKALAELGGVVIQPLLDTLSSNDSNLVAGAIFALRQLQVAEAAEPIFKIIEDRNNHVLLRMGAILELAYLADTSFIKSLANLISDQEHLYINGAILATLSRLGDEQAPVRLVELVREKFVKKKVWFFDHTSPIWSVAGDTVITPFAALFSDEEAVIRRNAIYILGTSIASPKVVKPLLQALEHSDVEMRHAAAMYLGQFKDKTAVRPLVGALEDPDVLVRWPAAKSLGQLGDKAASEPLLKLLEDKSLRVARSASWALSRFEEFRTSPTYAIPSPIAVEALEQAGWRPERRVDITEATNSIVAAGYSAFPAAEDFLKKFDGLQLKAAIAYKRPVTKSGFILNMKLEASKAVKQIERERLLKYQALCNSLLCPIGLVGPQEILMIDEAGMIYGDGDQTQVLTFYGETISDALDNLLTRNDEKSVVLSF
jgi:HEAT repeat protein